MSQFDRRRSKEEVRKGFLDEACGVFVQPVDTLEGSVTVKVKPCGSYRRALWGEDTDVGDLDLLVTANGPVTGMRDLSLPAWLTVTDKKASGWLVHGRERLMVDGWWCPWESIGPFSFFLTGPMSLNVWMRQRTTKIRPDLMLTQYGLFEAVNKPTPTYPDRKVPGRRVDAHDEGADGDESERIFWAQWARLMEVDKPYPNPHERSR